MSLAFPTFTTEGESGDDVSACVLINLNDTFHKWSLDEHLQLITIRSHYYYKDGHNNKSTTAYMKKRLFLYEMHSDQAKF